MTRQIDTDDYDIDRRTVLKSAGAAGALGLVGGSAFTGTAVAGESETDLEACRDIDIMCAIDTSGSLSSSEVSNLESAVNAFIDELPTDGTATVGTLEFGNQGVRNKNNLQDPGGLSVSLPDSGSGNTPMPGGLDIADQSVYGDAAARVDATKLVVVFTDGGPNYQPEASYTAGGYDAPRNQTSNWSAIAGNDVYDNGDTASATVSEGEMEETVLVANSIKDSEIGGGSTLLATVYVGDDDTEAMTEDAIMAYTDLPTYLSTNIATSEDLAINADLTNVSGLVDQLVAILEELCDACLPCETDGLLAKYEFECAEYDPEEEKCVSYDFVLEGDGDENISYTAGSYTSKEGEPNEPMSVTFETEYCDLYVLVKSGQEFEVQSFAENDGSVTVETANDDRYAISFVAFYCTEEAADIALESFPSYGRGGSGNGRGGGRPEQSR